MAVSLVPMKGSEHFLSCSHQHLHSHSHSYNSCCISACATVYNSNRDFWQRLANAQPETYWESVILPDTSDLYPLLGHHLRTFRSAPGMIIVEDCKTSAAIFALVCVAVL